MLTRHAALLQLESVTKELAANHRELATILAAEKEARVRTFMASDETAINARDRQGDVNTIHLVTESLKLKGEIAALEAERTYLLIVIEHGA